MQEGPFRDALKAKSRRSIEKAKARRNATPTKETPMTETGQQPPERIWLQHDPNDENEPGSMPPSWETGEISWCWERIGQSDVEYVRADLARPAPAEGAVRGLDWNPTTYWTTDDDNGPREGKRRKLTAWRSGDYWIIKQDSAHGAYVLKTPDGEGQIASPNLPKVRKAADDHYRNALSALSSPEDATPAGDKCDNCQRHYQAVYSVPNEVWAQIAPQPETLGPHIEHQGGGLLCPDCAASRATAKGIALRFTGTDGWPDATPAAPVSVEEATRIVETAAECDYEENAGVNDPDWEDLPVPARRSKVSKLVYAHLAQQDRRAALREMQSIREEMEGESGE